MRLNEESEPWTELELAELKRRWTSGESHSQVGAFLGRTRNAVAGMIYRKGWTRTEPTKPLAKKRADAKKRKTKLAAYQAKKRAAPSKPKVIIPKIPARELTGEPLDADTRYLKGQAWEPLGGNKTISLVDLTNHTCRWPVGNPMIGFCGHHTLEGKRYCDTHQRLATRRLT